ncbi:MAG: phosphodiester glycosidase family protein [Acetivibrionales bacterium]|jgi:exopolysaccharide biosynthesis protein
MRKKFSRSLKSLFAIFLCFSLIFTFLVGDSAFAAIQDFSSTSIYHDEERIIAPGVTLNIWKGVKNANTYKVGHTISFNPVTSDAKVLAAFGNSVKSRVTLSSTSKIEETRQGVSIIGGINGDYYYLENGVPIGLLIQNGRLISYSNTKWCAIGFNNDGSVVIDAPNIDMNFTHNGKQYNFGNLNKGQNDWGPYLYSSDFGPNTASTVPSLEVILDITSGEIKVDGTVTAKVSGIKINAKSTPIGENQLVLSARNNKPGFDILANFRIGDELTFTFRDVENKWANVDQAVGGDKILINNGAIVSGLSTTNYSPSTAVGVKADGEVVFFQVDGRSTLSQGVSSMETAQFLLKAGCVKAIQLDGGGSSAIIARMPGHSSPGLLNNPSDGSERANSNGLLLVSKASIAIKEGEAQKSTVAGKLHTYPGLVYALPDSTVQFSALATNENYLPADLPQQLVWVSSAGEIDDQGKLIVGNKPGKYVVMAVSGLIGGASEVIIPDKITTLKPSKSVLSLLPGDVIDLSCEAYYQNIKVVSTDSSFNWQVEGNIGTITPDGVFTMSKDAEGSGRIKVSYGNTSAYIDVSVPASPNAIEDFEGAIGWGHTTVRAKSANVSVIQDPSLARSGNGLLKLDYDFTLGNGVEKGVAGVYAYTLDPNTKTKAELSIKGDPIAIGMWVYGDNSRTWIRGSVRDGSGQSFYIDFTPEYKPSTGTGGVDWTGWRYVEAKIPSGRKGPFVLETPIRVMCSRDEMRTKGTLYFDQIRAIYSGDEVVQETVVKITSPADNTVIKTGKIPLAAEIITDPKGAGVDPASIQVLLDGAALSGLSITGNGNITIKGEMGSDLPLADGYHTLVINYTDFAGKTGTKAITFTVDTGAPRVIAATTPTTITESGSFATILEIQNPKNLRKIYADILYDINDVEVVDADSKTAGLQIELEPWVLKGKIITHRVDTTHGRITLEIDDLTNLSAGDTVKFGTITFKAKPSFQENTQIKLRLGAMIVGDNPASQRFNIPDMNVNMEYLLSLKVEGVNQGQTTTITVTDKSGNPVENAEIYLNEISYPFWKTDENGQVVTNLIAPMLEREPLKIRAKKDGQISKAVVLGQ